MLDIQRDNVWMLDETKLGFNQALNAFLIKYNINYESIKILVRKVLK